MKKLIYLLLAVSVFGACKSNKETKTDYTKMAGVYKSTFPCADCSGIEVALTLNKDETFTYNKVYRGKKDGHFTDKGKYKIKDKTLTIKEGNTEINFLIGENTLTLLNSDLKPSSNEFASYYKLKKQQRFNFNGRYETFSEIERGYRQTLDIFVTKKFNEYPVHFSASKIKGREGCNFSGVGHIKNDTLWVNIAVKKDKKIMMYVVPSHDNLGVEVFTKNFDERFEMMQYCRGGASLAGKYLKNSIRKNGIGVFYDSNTIEDVLNTIPASQIHKKIGHGEFKDDVYDDYEIYTNNNKHLFTLTPKDTANTKQKINRVLIRSPFFKTDKGINIKSTYKEIKNAYTINKIEPTREYIVLIVNEINASFSISKTHLQKGWWNDKMKKVNRDKIPENAQVDSFILWWNE
ncbi:MAG: copper resistance protein NlpE N-terminal domain-containing protein [Tenacibaculum sp.]|nr:copper resistance protein NlpE N-terminal domain-containing protein [Tenacibaculum sp.]